MVISCPARAAFIKAAIKKPQSAPNSKKCKTDEKVQHSITSVNADAGQFLLVNHQGNAVLRQVFLEKVDLVNGQ